MAAPSDGDPGMVDGPPARTGAERSIDSRSHAKDGTTGRSAETIRAPGRRGDAASCRFPPVAAHRAQARLPRPIDDDRIIRYLTAIDANGGSIPLTALAERTGEPADQLRMALTLVQRLLNLDGAAILTIGADQSVRLDAELLAFQFGVEHS